MNELLIVGLGNPGEEYKKTRHNVGFLVLDFLADKFSVCFKPKNESEIANFHHKGCSVIFLKPQTFMNLSGKAVSRIASFYKIPSENIVVIHDDLDIKFGCLKMKIGGGNGGHNGLKNIDTMISNDYWRFRIGIDRPKDKSNVVQYVLGNFDDNQIERINKISEKIFNNFDYLLEKDKHKLIEKINNGG